MAGESMTERIDHVAEAMQHISWAHEQQEREGDMGNVPRDDALLAQVHATLALVEQQRIANLIALARPHKLRNGAEVSHTVHDHVTGLLRPDVAEAVGL